MFSASSYLTKNPQFCKNVNEVFRHRSTERQAGYKLIRENLSPSLKSTWEKSSDNNFNILSVGCGDGSGGDFLILEIVKNFLVGSRRKPTLFNLAVEADKMALALFKESADSWASENTQVLKSRFQWFNANWQQYQTETQQDSTKFHLIHFISGIYCADVEDMLRDCMTNRLAKGGLVFCLSADPDNPSTRFQQALNFPDTSNEDVVSIAKKNGWKYECFYCPYHIDVTEMFDESSAEGNFLLDFFTQTENYRMVTDKSDVEKVEEYWLNDSKVGDNGKRKTFGKICAVIIYKS